MKYNKYILNFLFNILFLVIFLNPLKADDRICGNKLTNYIYDYHDDKFEYLEKRNDIGIFFDFDWDKVNEEIISLYDRLNRKNLRKVYPQNLFCNTAFSNECIIHDDKNIFFSDKYHPSTKGAELINKLIIKKIYSLNSYLDNLN